MRNGGERDAMLLVLNMEGKRHKPGIVGDPSKLKKQRELIFSQRLPKERSPADTLTVGLLTSRTVR